MMFPEQVKKFNKPVDLKEQLPLHFEGIFDLLKVYYHSSFDEHIVTLLLDRNVPLI